MSFISTASISFPALWQSSPAGEQIFQPDRLLHLPEPAQRYLNHAIAPGAVLATAVQLTMRGEIKLKQWRPFQAEQVIHCHHGLIWQARTRINGLPISGWDRLVQGEGAMRWKLFGLLPVITATGADVTRSALGRLHGELIWLPSRLCEATWTALDQTHTQAQVTALNATTELMLTIAETGQLEQFCFQRWGNPEGGTHQFLPFGGYLDREQTFAGYTIPTQVRCGWYFGSDRFEADGEFFRATIETARYR